MASTSITTVDGITIVTQVIPRDDSSLTVQTPPSAALEAPPPAAKVPPTPTKMNSKAAIFLHGEPQGLGVVQIFIGLLTVLFSLISVYSPALILYAPLGFAIIFVVSGSLAVAAGRRTSVRLVWASLVSNAFSALLGLVGVVYLCWLLAVAPPSQMFCSLQPHAEVRDLEEWRSKCAGKLWFLDATLHGLLGLHLVLFVLHTCAAVIVCVFSGKFIRRYKRYSPVMVGGDDANALLSSAAHEDDALTTPWPRPD